LEHQVDFLRENGQEVLKAVQSIQSDEAMHEERARSHGGNPSGIYLLLWRSIVSATACAIWLSTKL
jgi:demethoxyubiquinone hydroxylase (CLK1/Coq7/Cat5 family)